MGYEVEEAGVYQSLLCSPDLICLGSIQCSVIVMANASILMCSNTDGMFFRKQADNLGWELRGLWISIVLFYQTCRGPVHPSGPGSLNRGIANNNNNNNNMVLMLEIATLI